MAAMTLAHINNCPETVVTNAVAALILGATPTTPANCPIAALVRRRSARRFARGQINQNPNPPMDTVETAAE